VSSLDPLAQFRLDDRVAVVTGASSGLGARFARVLSAAGASVVLAARRAERLETLARDLPDAYGVTCDLSRPDDAAALVETTLTRSGRIDVLVNNAGINHVEPALEEASGEFRREIEVNLVAPFELSRLVARSIIAREGHGSIINVASILGLVGVGQIPDAGYAASKGGLVTLTRELAAQWARHGVRVNALAPGYFHSEMTDGTMFGDEQSEAWLARRTPLGRGGDEHELDGALLFLASAASSYVTGTVIPVDGGWTAI
jgi:NAD(P)-dependent dehydrogenase (short-subunit alcohol dehydrogenase family)